MSTIVVIVILLIIIIIIIIIIIVIIIIIIIFLYHKNVLCFLPRIEIKKSWQLWKCPDFIIKKSMEAILVTLLLTLKMFLSVGRHHPKYLIKISEVFKANIHGGVPFQLNFCHLRITVILPTILKIMNCKTLL